MFSLLPPPPPPLSRSSLLLLICWSVIAAHQLSTTMPTETASGHLGERANGRLAAGNWYNSIAPSPGCWCSLHTWRPAPPHAPPVRSRIGNGCSELNCCHGMWSLESTASHSRECCPKGPTGAANWVWIKLCEATLQQRARLRITHIVCKSSRQMEMYTELPMQNKKAVISLVSGTAQWTQFNQTPPHSEDKWACDSLLFPPSSPSHLVLHHHSNHRQLRLNYISLKLLLWS